MNQLVANHDETWGLQDLIRVVAAEREHRL
jgi:hypothetical protein